MVSVLMCRSSSRKVALISNRPPGVRLRTISSPTVANISPGSPAMMCDAIRTFSPDGASVILLLMMVLSVLLVKNASLSSNLALMARPEEDGAHDSIDVDAAVESDCGLKTALGLNPPFNQHRLRLRGIVLDQVDDLPSHPRRLRDGGRADVLREHVTDDVELRPIEARLPAPIAPRLDGLGVGYAR